MSEHAKIEERQGYTFREEYSPDLRIDPSKGETDTSNYNVLKPRCLLYKGRLIFLCKRPFFEQLIWHTKTWMASAGIAHESL